MQAQRVFLVVLDSLGIGEMPDAASFGDSGANTIGHIADAVGGLKLPNLEKMGLGNIAPIRGLKPQTKPTAHYGKCAELARGKDTTTGHWEMAGLQVTKPFPTYYEGFPETVMQAFVEKAGVSGFLGNFAASGTEIIQQLGDEHVKSGKPIVYTSADSVFQIACHEESFGLERLYEICEVARKICDEFGVARVIARPFLGANGAYTRTKNRKDYSIALPAEPIMPKLQRAGFETVSIGKVASIYSEEGFSRKVKAADNRAIFAALLAEAKKKNTRGLVFANLVDFDMLYGHRRNAPGYAAELAWFDSVLPELLAEIGAGDLLMLTADHGNDPTYKGTDHTREYVPLIAYTANSAQNGGKYLGIRKTFADMGQSILAGFSVSARQPIGESFWSEL